MARLEFAAESASSMRIRLRLRAHARTGVSVGFLKPDVGIHHSDASHRTDWIVIQLLQDTSIGRQLMTDLSVSGFGSQSSLKVFKFHFVP